MKRMVQEMALVLYCRLTFNPILFTGNCVQTFNYFPPVPAGIAFNDNKGASGATIAQLNNLGQGILEWAIVPSSPLPITLSHFEVIHLCKGWLFFKKFFERYNISLYY
jgi:hypothetical protein